MAAQCMSNLRSRQLLCRASWCKCSCHMGRSAPGHTWAASYTAAATVNGCCRLLTAYKTSHLPAVSPRCWQRAQVKLPGCPKSCFWRFHTSGVTDEGVCTIEALHLLLRALAGDRPAAAAVGWFDDDDDVKLVRKQRPCRKSMLMAEARILTGLACRCQAASSVTAAHPADTAVLPQSKV